MSLTGVILAWAILGPLDQGPASIVRRSNSSVGQLSRLSKAGLPCPFTLTPSINYLDVLGGQLT